MEIDNAIQNRRTIRFYESKPVEKEKIQKVIEDAIRAPSSLNEQPWRFIVVSDKKRDEAVSIISHCTRFLDDILSTFSENEKEYVSSFFNNLGGAPVLIVMVMPKVSEVYNNKIQLIANGSAVQNMALSAFNEGLGTCCLTSSLFVEGELKKYLDIGEDEEIVTVMLLGYPDEKPSDAPRDFERITWFG